MKTYNVKDFGTGCIESSYDARDYILNVASSINLPDKFEVTHSKIKDQGSVGSCVAHSVCEVLEAANNNEELYSTDWIYGYRPDGYYVGPGMSTRDACNTVVDKGYVKLKDFPGNTEMLKAMHKVNNDLPRLLDLAKYNKALSYNRLKGIYQIKEAIYISGLPALIIVKVPNEITLDDNYIVECNINEDCGCHCMVCYGWNEYGLLIQNSWGKDWGNDGCAILPYEYPIVEAWAVSCESSTNIASKPKMWCFRKFIQKVIKLFRK